MLKFTVWEYIQDILIPSLGTTFNILLWTMIFSSFFGFFLAIALAITGKGGIRENRRIYKILETGANVIRSFPFIILVVAMVPVTRKIIGTSIG